MSRPAWFGVVLGADRGPSNSGARERVGQSLAANAKEGKKERKKRRRKEKGKTETGRIIDPRLVSGGMAGRGRQRTNRANPARRQRARKRPRSVCFLRPRSEAVGRSRLVVGGTERRERGEGGADRAHEGRD